MYCPKCGNPLTCVYGRDEAQAASDAAMVQWAAQDWKGDEPFVDQSEHWACYEPSCPIGNDEGTPADEVLYLHVHHPIHGEYDTRGPGDSWSISWVK